MKIKPLITEKSLSDAKLHWYTFQVDPSLSKHQIKLLISEMFDVNPIQVRTNNQKSRTKKTIRGNIKTIQAKKKALVKLPEKEKIDLFKEE